MLLMFSEKFRDITHENLKLQNLRSKFRGLYVNVEYLKPTNRVQRMLIITEDKVLIILKEIEQLLRLIKINECQISCQIERMYKS